MDLTLAHLEDFLTSKIIEADNKPVPYHYHDVPKELTTEEVIAFARKAIRFEIDLGLASSRSVAEEVKIAKQKTKKDLFWLGFNSRDEFIKFRRKISNKSRNLYKHAKIYQDKIIENELKGEFHSRTINKALS